MSADPRSARARVAIQRTFIGSVVALSIAFGVAAHAATAPAAAPSGAYTTAQAAQGGSVYAANCASCHAANLSRGSGPALTGPAFAKSIDANYKTAAQLYDFIKKQMPLNAPGSLSQQNYLAVTAYIL